MGVKIQFISSKKTFEARETHGRVLRPENRVIAQSQDVGWRSLHAAIFEEAPFKVTEAAVPHPSLIYHLRSPTRVARKVEGCLRTVAVIGPRSISLTPAETAAHWQHAGNPEILQIYVRQSIYATAVNELYGCDAKGAEVIPRFAILDPLLEQLAISVAAALRNGNTKDGLYIETLAQMMAMHLAVHHSSRSTMGRHVMPKSIPSWKMRRVIDFIEDNLGCDLSLGAMAEQIQISPLYLPRIFKATVGKTPHQYVLERRIERAKLLLHNSEVPVSEVARAVGFSSQSHLSSLFLRSVGISPTQYRSQRKQ